VCSCFDVCWSFGVVGWGGIRVAGSQPAIRIPPQPATRILQHTSKQECPKHVEHRRSEIKLHKLWHQVGLLFFNSLMGVIPQWINTTFVRSAQHRVSPLHKILFNLSDHISLTSIKHQHLNVWCDQVCRKGKTDSKWSVLTFNRTPCTCAFSHPEHLL